MADIDVVPKHRSNMWLWIVLAIVAVAIIIWAISGRSNTRTASQLHVAPVDAIAAHAPGGVYVTS